MKKGILVTILTICSAFAIPMIALYCEHGDDTAPGALGLGSLVRPLIFIMGTLFGLLILPIFMGVELVIAKKNEWPKLIIEIINILFVISLLPSIVILFIIASFL